MEPTSARPLGVNLRQSESGHFARIACAECRGTALRGATDGSSANLQVVAAQSAETFVRLLRTGILLAERNRGMMREMAANHCRTSPMPRLLPFTTICTLCRGEANRNHASGACTQPRAKNLKVVNRAKSGRSASPSKADARRQWQYNPVTSHKKIRVTNTQDFSTEIDARNNKPCRSGPVVARYRLLLAAREAESSEADPEKRERRRFGNRNDATLDFEDWSRRTP